MGHGVFRTPDSSTVCVLAGPAPPEDASSWISNDLRSSARARVSAWDDEEARTKKSEDDFRDFMRVKRPDYRDEGWQASLPASQPTIEHLIGLLPIVLAVDTGPVLDERIDDAAAGILKQSGPLRSRDGTYEGLRRRLSPKRVQGLILHEPYVGPPSYPEVRWAVFGRIPSALYKPRIAEIARTEFGEAGPLLDLSEIGGALNDLSLDDDRLDERVGEVKGAISDGGFEAIA